MRLHYPLNSQGAEDAGKLPWTDGVPSTGVQGSYPGHAIVTHSEAEILAAIEASGQTPNGSDLTQLVQALARGIYVGQFSGTANALAAAIPNGIVFSSLLRGTRFTGFVTATNTAGVTAAITCLGGTTPTVTAPLLRKNGTALQSGDLPVNQDFEFKWDGNAFRFVGAVASDGGGTASGSAVTHGRVQLARAGSNAILLAPRNGNGVVVAGTLVALPATGVTAGLTGVPVNGANGNLAASTAYYVALAVVAGSPVLRFWSAASYGHMPDTTAGNVGVEVIANAGAPVSTDTLVGLVYLDASGAFKDADGARYLLSWFNDQRKVSRTTFTADRYVTSTTPVEVNAEIRNGFLCWAGRPVRFRVLGTADNAAAGNNHMHSQVSFDGAAAEFEASTISPFDNANDPTLFVIDGQKTGLSEGVPHYCTLLANVQNSANAGRFYALSNPAAWVGGCQVLIETQG